MNKCRRYHVRECVCMWFFFWTNRVAIVEVVYYFLIMNFDFIVIHSSQCMCVCVRVCVVYAQISASSWFGCMRWNERFVYFMIHKNNKSFSTTKNGIKRFFFASVIEQSVWNSMRCCCCCCCCCLWRPWISVKRLMNWKQLSSTRWNGIQIYDDQGLSRNIQNMYTALTHAHIRKTLPHKQTRAHTHTHTLVRVCKQHHRRSKIRWLINSF